MRLLFIGFIFFFHAVHADTIKNYINIANNIPQMEIKADPQAQAWARSARQILNVTCESIQETILQANEIAKKQGDPFFCLPAGVQLDPAKLNALIQQTYKEIPSQQSDKDAMTISQIAWIGLTKSYPCKPNNGMKTALTQINNAWGTP